MPELPEVETIRRDLNRTIVNKKIVSIEVRDPRIIKGLSPLEFKKHIRQARVNEVLRRGKVLIIGLDNKKYLIIHLRIAGWLIYPERQEKARVVFEFSDHTFLNYMDQRALGELRLVDDYAEFSFLNRLGPEPFKLTPQEFSRLLSKKKTNIKNLLMNQEVIAGIGNIYAQEALFLSGIAPQRRASSLNSQEVKRLLNNLVAVLKKAIRHKGSSIDLYRDALGNKGGMQKCLLVYDKKGQPCHNCQTKIVKINIAGRGTCFCPKCQT